MTSSPTAAAVEQEVREADARRVQALTSNDLAALEQILADDLTYVHTTGRQDTKQSYLNSLRSGSSRYVSMETEEQTVRAFGDTAVVTGKLNIRVQAGGAERNLQPRVLIVYAKRDGRWQMVAWQTTNVAPPAA